MEELREKGGISVATEHIFPVIKKWLYSEKEIFLREIVSNACDAITKLKRLEALGKYDGNGEAYRVDVSYNKEAKTLTVSDNGIGMNSEEVKKYICNIALSGALEFIQKYEEEKNDSGIIGHFGLGFYSAFMVSSTVDVITKSIDGSGTVKLVCTENGEYTLESAECERSRHGTDIVMHINSEGEEYLEGYKLKEVMRKYCAFMPIEIYLTDECEEIKENDDKLPEPINDTSPLWQKNASDCSDEEYKDFYNKVFNDFKEPLFQIHINADYPLNFKGILYFPRIQSEYESLEGQVKLYYNQVFVADNIKEVIPEYLLMLRGVLDCPELPLNVSRSYLQNSGYVSKISAHIAKKTADKLCGIFNTERERFEGFWRDIKIFCEYGSLKDHKFFDRIKNIILFEKTDGKLLTADEYIENAKDKYEGKIYYATDKVTQAQYISLFESEGIEVVLLDKVIDTQFITLIEQEKNVKFLRIDADVADALKNNNSDSTVDENIVALFREASKNSEMKVSFESLKDASVPAILNITEESRRMTEMMKMYGMPMDSFKEETSLVVNTSSELIKKLGSTNDEKAKLAAAEQIYTLALLSQRQLTPEEMKNFISTSLNIIEKTL
ncbi:MAG: molecular chaperone HtpG [Ruminococcaceae bacterium]|nr:molecular chaperone HtpG [Oscillospiraceae bacterium]